MDKKHVMLVVFVTAIALFAMSAAAAVDCWSFTTQQNCDANSVECRWMSDAWGGWCEQKGCWNFWTQDGCQNASNEGAQAFFINKSCSWNPGTQSWCHDIGCWSFDGTNESACRNNSASLTCSWEQECVGPPDKQCWNYQGAANCSAVSGCTWGGCFQESCWDYSTNSGNCTAHNGTKGGQCLWNAQNSNCYEAGCRDYNYTVCIGPQNTSCSWSSGMCTQKMCSDFSFTNTGNCTGNAAGLSCKWEGPYCKEKGCWSYNSLGTCNADAKCSWQTQEGGWCSEAGCWNWDNISQAGAASEAGCLDNATAAGLSCIYDPNGGWCFENLTMKGCSDFLGERACFDSFYCMWNKTNATHGQCIEPPFQSFAPSWNPGCYIFPNQGNCTAVTGCTWDGGTQECTGLGLGTTGLNCSVITSSQMCNSIPALSTCCVWQGSACAADAFSKKCWDQMQAPPVGATYCEDYNSFTSEEFCSQIAGSPWFMPCKWNNGTKRCNFKASNVFGTGQQANFMLIDNKQNCEFAGGKWVTESYCSGSVAVPTGRCEFKFNEEKNCDRSCKACEYKSDGTNWSTTVKANEACVGSKLGFCTFEQNANAPNAKGFCKVKTEFKTGVATGTCDTGCMACTYMGDATAANADKRPSYFCKNSKAGCKWVPDLKYPTDEAKGRCTNLAEKTCEDACDRCYSLETCNQYGAKKGDQSLGQKCQWDSATGFCGMLSSGSGGASMEVCWNGMDDNNDGKTDCADSKCFSDPFCGGGFMGSDCFGYSDSTSCTNNNCYWVSEPWGSWCDMPGAACWKRDGTNETFCEDDGVNNDTCEWHSGFGGMCEQDWQIFDSCLGLSSDQCTLRNNLTYNCTWMNSSMLGGGGGGWCDPNPAYSGGGYYDCAQYDFAGEAVCNSSGTPDGEGDYPCKWFVSTFMSGDGWCDHLKFSCEMHLDNSTCISNSSLGGNPAEAWCYWDGINDTDGYCYEYEPMLCDQAPFNINATNCAAAGCNWKTGFCDPKGFGDDFGSGEGKGFDCMVHNGNELGCTGQPGCSYIPQPTGFCDLNSSAQCPGLGWVNGVQNQTLCTANPLCFWNDMMGPEGYCDFKIMECQFNQTRQLNEGNCTESENCRWDSFAPMNNCQPKCFGPPNVVTQQACAGVNITGTPVCAWVNGFCGDAMSSQFFQNMEGGAPVMLGSDAIGDTTSQWVDIKGFGMKDMGKAYGFGISVSDIAQAALCNKQNVQIQPGVSVMANGMNTTRFYWYLDTDGNRTGNCAAKHNSSATGYEFHLLYRVRWDNSQQAATETFVAERCLNSQWVAVDIKLSGFKQMACSEIGGGVVAVDKIDLEKFPSLYSRAADMRVAVGTGDEDGNVTHPTDTAAPGFMTPGALDFDLDSLNIFSYASNGSSNFGADYASKGYVEYSADCWSQSGCADYACYNHPYCVANSYGVHAAGFQDTRTPKVIAMSKEPYPDATMIIYFTDKPANGTLFFYSTDSTCSVSGLNATINDIGITSTYSRDYKLWHRAEIYNDGGTNSLNYALSPDTLYYYKLQVCDDAGKCALSKCSGFMTANPQSCPFCNFVTQIKAPAGWTVSYDLDQNSAYEHVQGQVCGPNAGMKTNYTDGRRADIRLSTSDNTTWLEFLNARLTKTGLTSKTRDVETSGSLQNGTTTISGSSSQGYVGMLTETRDKIVNNLYPEKCLAKIPSNGTCSELWQCSDSLTGCVNRTADPMTRLNETGSDYCIWEVPYCEFSVYFSYVTASPAVTPPTSPGGGGGAVTTPEKVTQTKMWAAMKPGVKNVMKIYTAAIGLDQLTFEVTGEISNAEVTVTKLEKRPADVGKEAAANVYRYLQISLKGLTDGQISSAALKFHVEKAWLTEQAGTADAVRLYRYSGASWKELATTRLSAEDNDTYRYFEAASPGLSYFAIGLKEAEAAPSEEPEMPTGQVIAPPEPSVEPPAEQPPVEPPVGPKAPFQAAIFTIVVATVLGTTSFGYIYLNRAAIGARIEDFLTNLKRSREKRLRKK